MSQEQSFTGRRRERRTTTHVKLLDTFSRWLITAGGLGTIVSVFTVALFLVWVVVPLFAPAQIHAERSITAPTTDAAPVRVIVDEYQLMGWGLLPNGWLHVFRLDDGATLSSSRALFDGAEPTAIAVSNGGRHVTFGFADGTLRLATLTFEPEFLEDEDVPEALRGLREGEIAVHDGGMLQRTPEGQLRVQRLIVEEKPPLATGSTEPVVLLDRALASKGSIVCALTDDDRLHHVQLLEKKSLLTGRVKLRTKKHELPYAEDASAPPSHVLVSGLGDNVFLAWPDGRLLRYDVRDPRAAQVAQEVRIVPDAGETVTSLSMLLGRSTLLVGQSNGRFTAWFRTKPDHATTPDGNILVKAHDVLEPDGKAITAVATSSRSRLVAVGDESGRVRVIHVTSGKSVAETRTADEPVTALMVSPKDDGFVALTPENVWHWEMDPRHPEAGLKSLFGRVWYEGYEAPEHVWQSSSGTDDFEMKLGLVPLIFGTLKATLYSMIFGAPLALLAAIYTSEFLQPRAKSRIKPTIELMASLPSVVLGFLAALVVAPFVENVVPALLTCFFAMPAVFLLGAHAWQLLPQETAFRLAPWRLWFLTALLPIGILVSVLIAPLVEALFFAGDFKSWADGQIGNGTGAWVLLLLPLIACTVFVVSDRVVDPRLRPFYKQLDQRRTAAWELGKLVASAIVTVGVAWGLAAILDGVGWDPRGGFVDTYVQRNALVVGFIMGFAIIPIIYTISEDALARVPEHLRGASLGSGATPWQTAVRIVIPTAMSGLFSALMIGLGRAVGETMIVLMAAGNTPVMDLNVFNGFRTLSANIAVELPEAVRDSTHYRTLFLAALTLFVLTFIVNTAAEVVRLRFRKRAFEL